MSAITRSNRSLLDLTIMKKVEKENINKQIPVENASEALSLIDEDTVLFGLKGNEYPNGHPVAINFDTKTFDQNKSLDQFLLTRVQIPANLLRSILQHPSLTYISLTEGALYGDERVTQFCAGLENNEKIRTLNLINNHFSTAQLEAIIKVIGTMKVERFFIAGNDCNTSSIKLLADSLPTNIHLKEITLSPRHVDATYAENIRKILQDSKTITSIHLYPIATGAEPSYLLTRTDLTNILEAVKTNSSLQTVSFMGSLVESDARGEFAKAWSQQVSEALNADRKKISPQTDN